MKLPIGFNNRSQGQSVASQISADHEKVDGLVLLAGMLPRANDSK